MLPILMSSGNEASPLNVHRVCVGDWLCLPPGAGDNKAAAGMSIRMENVRPPGAMA